MKCYYEELGVSRDANDADIKTAYRKLALRWHPDKNPDSLDEAKERFQLIQQAYEVLSDPQERAWYDNHRDQILRGKNSEYTENCLDVFEYFTSSCFRGYGDDEKGFYSVYRQVFEKIAAEDAEFMDDEDEVEQIPTFGDSKSSYEDVVAPFYAYWQAYCTKKTYTWLCPYNVKEIRDRRVLREVEKEMKKIMQKARKERNEEVRNLVSFIRKRDKRVQAYRKVLEERAELNRKKQEQNRLEQIRKRQRELEEMRENHKQHNQNNDEYETLLKQLAQDYSDSSAEEDSETDDDEDEEEENEVLESAEEDFYVDDLYCVACNKAFTNERAYANHESSKKHREALERMILEMQAEEEALQANNDAEEEEESEDLVDNGADEVEIDEKDVQRQTEEFVEAANASVTLDKDEASEEEEPASRKAKKNKKARKNAKLNKAQRPIEDDEQEETVSADFLAQAKIADSDEEDWNSSGKKSARKNKNKKQVKKASMEDEKANLSEQNAKVTEKQEDKVTILQKEVDEVSETVAADVVVKKTQPKAKSKVVEESTATTNVCVTCKATFPSKNKLFNHLKITNHGVYIPKAKTEVNAASAEGKSKKGKGKKK